MLTLNNVIITNDWRVMSTYIHVTTKHARIINLYLLVYLYLSKLNTDK